MQIQRIVFPTESGKNTELYIRGYLEQYQISDGDTLAIMSGSVSFDTYFNGFFVDKWLKYTRLTNLSFRFYASGKLSVDIYVKKGRDSDEAILLAAKDVVNDKDEEYEIDISIEDCKSGIIYVVVTNRGTGIANIRDGVFVTDVGSVRSVKMLIAICTYKREDYLYRNLEIIKDKLRNRKDSLLYENIDVVIADNASTIKDKSVLEEEWIIVKPNKNAGGASGFARGMMYAIDRNCYTHVLLMDDDVTINPEAIERTYAVLALLRDEYMDAFIGGAMLRSDYTFVQQESGASFEKGRIVSYGNGIDLRKVENIMDNSFTGRHADYNAWWYCCIPTTVIKDKGYPLPIFIHNDDVEYGLRCEKPIILMNGICVWHDSFEHKRPSANEYYDVRNALIINSLYNSEYSGDKAFQMVCRRILTNLLRYRYRDIELNLRGAVDFLKGATWLMDEDASSLHKEIMEQGYKYNQSFEGTVPQRVSNELEDILEGRNNSNSISKKKLVTLNGWIFPAKSKEVVPIMAGESPHAYYRIKKVWIYDPDTKKGFYTERRYGQLWKLPGKILNCKQLLKKEYILASSSYKENFGEMTSLEFWKKYLENEVKENEKQL